MKPGDGEGMDTDALAKLLEGFVQKDEFDSFKDRVEKLEKEMEKSLEKQEKHDKKFKKNKKKLKDHEEEIEKLKKHKVEQSTFDAEINFIKNILNKHSGDKFEIPPATS